METPRDTRQAQPEIHFAGGSDVLRSAGDTDPAVSAAFIAFHKNLGKVHSRDDRKGFISRGGLALAALAVLGFGGGLSLALFAFNSPDGPRSAVAARPPEIIYTAPATLPPAEDAGPDQLYAAAGELPSFADTRFELRAQDQAVPETSIAQAHHHGGVASFGSLPGSLGGAGFAALGEQAFPGGSMLDAPAADITGGFGALTAAPVPEPSTWATLVSGAGLLVLFGKFKRRRG